MSKPDITSYTHALERVNARHAVSKFAGIDFETGSSTTELAELLGYINYTDLSDNHTEEVSRVLRLLAGPHGLAIYKALKARKQDGS